MEAPRTVEDVFDNFSNRRAGLIKALTGAGASLFPREVLGRWFLLCRASPVCERDASAD